jgi:hypothetical protein
MKALSIVVSRDREGYSCVGWQDMGWALKLHLAQSGSQTALGDPDVSVEVQ